MTSETKFIETPEEGTVMVQKIHMCGGGNLHVFSAWRKEPEGPFGKHHMITTTTAENGATVWWGQVGTCSTPGIEKMKGGSPERIAAVREHRQAQAELARLYIVTAFPETRLGQPRWGSLCHEIEMEVTP